MATYSVKAPNGSTYEVTGPDGATEEEVRAQVLAAHPDAAEPAVKASDDMGYDPKTLIGRGPRSANNGSGNPEDVREPTPFRGYDPAAMEEKVTREGLDKPTVMGGDLSDKSLAGGVVRTLAEGLTPTAAGLFGGRLGMMAGAPLGPLGAGAGALGGGALAGWSAKTAQDALLRAYPESYLGVQLGPTQRQVDVTQHPLAVPLAASALGFLSGAPGRAKSFLEPVISGAIGGTFEAANEAMSGQKLNPAAIAGVSGLSALQYKPWGLSNMAGSRISDLENMLIRSRGVDPNEARQIATDMLAAGTPAVPADLFSAQQKSNFGKVADLAPTGHESVTKYAEDTLANAPRAGQKVVSQLAPTDARTAEQAAAEAAKDIAEHPDVVAAKPTITRGEAGASVHERLNNERDAAWSGVNQAYDDARTMGDAFVTPESGNEIIQSIDKALEPAKRRYKTEIPSTMNILGYASELIKGGKPKIQDLFDVRSDLTAIMGDKAGTPDAAAAREMRTALDKVVDDLDAGGMIVGDPSAVAAWRNAISSRREFGTKFEGNDIIETLTDRTSKGGAKTTSVDPADVENLLFGKGSVSGAKGQTDNLRRLRERLGETSPEWEAIRTAAAERLFGKDFGTPKFGATLDKFRRENPTLADLLITPNDEAALSKAQGIVSEAVGRQGAQSAASSIMSTNPTDFANSVSAMSRAALRDARVAARQVLRDAMNNPKKSEDTLRQLASQPDSQDNIIALFGEDEGRQLIRSATAVTRKMQTAAEILPKPPSESGEDVRSLANVIPLAMAGAKATPTIILMRFLENVGMKTGKAKQIVDDALDPSKTDEVIAMIEKNYGANAGARFAKRVANVMATQHKKPLIVNKVTATSSVTRPEPKETKPEEKAKEPEGSTNVDYDIDYLASKIEGHEGTGKNPKSTALGPFQFITGTLRDTYNEMHPGANLSEDQVEAMRKSGEISDDDLREMGKFHTQKNVDFLIENKLPLTAANVYLMHFAGRGATPKVIAAEPTAPITDVLSADQIAANSNIEFEGKRFPDFMVQDLRDWANDVML